MKHKPAFFVEVGEGGKPSKCACCNANSFVGHGFVFKNNDARAIYYASWAVDHEIKHISFALAIGEWDDASTTDDRVCFGIEAYDARDEIWFKIIGPDESPWPTTETNGQMLEKRDAKTHPLLKEAYLILKVILENHKEISKYLHDE